MSPYLTVKGASKAIEFYQAAFGATELYRLSDPSTGSVGHAEIMLNGSLIMLSDENLAWGNKSPETLAGTPVKLCLMVENTDAAVERASPQVPSYRCRLPTCSMASVVPPFKIPLAING